MPGRPQARDSACSDSSQPLVPSQPTSYEFLSGLPGARRPNIRMELSYHFAAKHAAGRDDDQGVNPAEVLTSSVNSLSEQMRWRASLSSSRSSRLQESWNHNLHYHRLIIDVIAPDCQRSLDVGCGQGALTRRLRPLVPDVAGMDRDERSIPLARTRAQAPLPDIP